MHRLLLLAVAALPVFAQQYDLDGYTRLLKEVPGTTIADKVKLLDSLGITLSDNGQQQLSRATTNSTQAPAFLPVPDMAVPAAPFGSPELRGADPQHSKLGNLNSNPSDPNSASNPYGIYGSPYSPNSVNPYGVYGSPYSPYSANNPYTTQAPRIVAPNGQYLGRYSANPYDPDSTSNPYGQYGSPHSPNSINNPYGVYGSPYSPSGVRNPFSVGASSRALPTMPSLPRLSMPSLPALPSLPTLPSLVPPTQ
jgi:hypothetical protein